MNDGDGVVWHGITKDALSIAIDDQSINEVEPGEAGRSKSGVFMRELNAKKIVLRPILGGRLDKEPFAGTDFHFQGCISSKERGVLPGTWELVNRLEVLREIETGISFAESSSAHAILDQVLRTGIVCRFPSASRFRPVMHQLPRWA